MRPLKDVPAIGLGRPLLAGMLMLAGLAPAALTGAQTALAAQPGGGTSAASAGGSDGAGMAISVRHADLNVLTGGVARIAGRLHPATPGAPVLLQLRRHHRWVTVGAAASGARGYFRLRYRARSLGTHLLRIEVGAQQAGGGSLAGPALCPGPCGNGVGVGGTPPATHRLGELNVYRAVEASWYGGGGSLACGGWLTSGTLGVANKTLPCGTLVTLRYGSHTVRVPVIDRGPYVEGREFDLTEATRAALGFPGTGLVWSTR
jgi:rare lipoprotein A